MSRIVWYNTNMTANNAPAPFVASASTQQSNTYSAWKAFDGIISPTLTASSWSATSTLPTGWIQIYYGSQKAVNIISITIYGYNNSPKDFKVLGSNDGANWEELLDVVNYITWNQVGENDTKIFELNKEVNYSYYRLDISATNATGTTNLQPIITEIKFGIFEYEQKHLLQSNNKIYSLDSIDTLYETKMTSNTAPSPFVASASSVSDTVRVAYKAFDGVTGTNISYWATAFNPKPMDLTLDFGHDNEKFVNRYKMTSSIGAVTSTPKSWVLYGSNNGTNWDLLDKKTEITWSISETKTFSFVNAKKYRMFRMSIGENNGDSRIIIDELTFGYIGNKMIKIPIYSTSNVVNYGQSIFINTNHPMANKNYILQDTVSENEEGLWTTQLDRKPLSIGFN